MDEGRKSYRDFLDDRVFTHKLTTIAGLIVAIMSAAGSELEKQPEYYKTGSLLVSSSSFLGAVCLFLAKDREQNKGDP